MNANMQEKALRVLECAWWQFFHSPEDGARRLADLQRQLGEKVVRRKHAELCRRGYVNAAGITEKGTAALRAHGREGRT